ncbi:transmembrane protein, putative (macronuclear) [Tetrahymena thermophila SB210]|uniref:Transmembrane protein, putative n=1 Tax=Tetrahymena thermophila (strain SB210) TaxID=312017 RepID=Q23R49_TETTS|nr:transmembrane protein, putative [Tetrahymena thermophila SB210]EAR98992.2 transmembrane protein, putative [Tetrahymena thermophila SB210]|eukprot:XP_001019237.2 transmembrane protein, putative [Tetrahymena thermophila SB210]
MINYFFDLACSEFELDAMKIQIEQNEKLIDIILFDEDIENCNKQLKDCLNLKYDILQNIGKDYINLKDLEKQLQILLHKRVNLRRELIRLQKIHSLSSDLISLCEGFEECLTIDQDLTKLMQMQKSNRFGVKNYLLNYSDDSAAIYISLLNEIGKILKVSKNFKDIVPLVTINQEAIGKNVKFLLPNEIAQVHDEILYKSMILRKQINYNVKDYPLLLGKDRDGWAIAYNLKIQTFILNNNELGCCGLLKQIKGDNMYLMCLKKENNRIAIQDKKFYRYILNKYFSQSEAKQVFISSIIPIFKMLQVKGIQGQQYETLLFQPQNIEEATLDLSTANQQFIQMVSKRKIYLIKFSFYQIENEIIQLTQLQVSQIKPLLDINSKKDALRNFKIQLHQYANEDSVKNLSELNDYLNSIIEKTDCEDIQQNLNTQIESEERSNLLDNTQRFNNETEQYQKSEDNFIFIDSSNKIAINEDKLLSKPIDTLGQIQEETEQNSLCSPELDKRKVKIKQINLIKNEQLIQLSRKPNLFDFQHPNNKIYSSTYQNQQQQVQSIGSLGTLATQKYLSTNNIQNQVFSSEINSPQNLLSQESNHNQNILSSDSMHFSPKSSQRKMLIQSNEQNKYNQFKIDKNVHQNQLNTIEDEVNQKYTTRKRESTQSTNYYEIKNQMTRNRNTSTIKNRKTSEIKSNIKSGNQKQEGYSNNIRTPQNDGNADDFKDEGSVKSSKSQRSQSNTIRKKGDSKCLKLINILGILSIIIICCLNITIFELQLNFQYIQKINFEQINWTFSLKRFINIFFGNNFLILGLKSNFYQIKDQNIFKKLGKLILGANAYMYQGYQNQTQQLIQGNLDDIYVFQEINNYSTELSIASTTNSTQITNYTSHLTFKIAFFQTIGYYVASLLDTNQYNTQVGLQNFMSINSSLDEIYENNQNYQLDKIDNIKSFIFGQLIVISVVTGIFSCLSIPIYMFNMKKKEDILKLFATISPDKILQMMMQINRYLEMVENMESKKHRSRNISHQPSQSQLKQKNSEPQNIQNSHISVDRDNLFFSSNQIIFKKPLENMKKKNISSTSSIKKFSFKLVIGIVICFCFTLFYPVANYVSSLQNIDTYQMNIYFLNAFDYLIDNLTSLFCLKYSHTYLLIATKGKYPQLPFYSNTIKSQLSKTQSYLDRVMDNFQKYEDYNGYMQSYYDSLMIPLVKSDICKTLNGTNPVYFREISFDYDNCVSCLNGIFQQGLVVMQFLDGEISIIL